MKISLSADLPISCDTYLLERDGDIFRKLLSSHLSLTKMHFNTPPITMASQEEEEEATYHLITSPDLDWIPSSLRGRVDQHKAEFIDIITYRRSSLLHSPYSLTVSTHSPLLGNRLEARFTLTIQALGPHSCRQTLVGTIKVTFPGLGTIIGHAVKDSLTKTYSKLPMIVEEYVKMRNEMIESGREEALVVGVPLLQNAWLNIPWIHQQQRHSSSGGDRILTSVDTNNSNSKKKMKMEDEQQGAIDLDVQSFEDDNGSTALLPQPQPTPPVIVKEELQLVTQHYRNHLQSFKQQFIQYLIRTLCIMALLTWILLIRLHIITVSSPSVRRRAATTKRSKSKKKEGYVMRVMRDKKNHLYRKEMGLPAHLVGILERSRSLSPQSLEAAKQAAAALPPESRGVQRDPADVLRVARSQSLDTTWVKYKREILDITESCF